MAITIALANQKGGVGKTTSTVEIASVLTKLEKKYPEFSDLVYSWHLDLMLKYTEDNNQIYKYVKAHYKYFSKLPQDSRVYKLSMDLYKK